jgi:UDP-glucose:(heptosyl)LPS alpha-1,3-glucosyltransferase
VRFLAWYLFNYWRRLSDRTTKGIRFDYILPPGINCGDANAVFVHAVFHRLAELQEAASSAGLRALHRRMYYRLVCHLERRIYSRANVTLAAVSRRTATQLARYFGRTDVKVIPYGVDQTTFNPGVLARLRDTSRDRWNFAPHEVVLLLVGNDWRNKGLPALLNAASLCLDLPLRMLVVGQDDATPFIFAAQRLNVLDRIKWAAPTADVLQFYAAADVLVSPSLEDSFNLPCLEAMACGLPVIVSPEAGISEWVTQGEDAVLLNDPRDATELAQAIRRLASDPERARWMGQNAVRTASKLTWDRHAEAVYNLLNRGKDYRS